MFEIFTEAAIRAIATALQAAKVWGHEKAGAEHILIGLSAHHCLAQELFVQKGITTKSLEKGLLTILVKKSPSNKVDVPFDVSAKNVFTFAQSKRSELGHRQLSTGHLLLGIIADNGSRASQLLAVVAGNNQQWSSLINAAIATAAKSPEFETVPEQKVSREDQLAAMLTWARTIPNWKDELKFVMQAVGITAAEVEEGLRRTR